MAEIQTNHPAASLSSDEKLAEAKDYFKSSARLLVPPIYRAAYSDRMAWIMASMAHLAYDRFEEGGEALNLFTAKLEGGGFKLIKTFNSDATGTQAFLAASDEFAVLAFRGTEPSRREDIKTDAMARRLATIQGRVHKGFEVAYVSIEKDVEMAVRALKDFPLYITGHSLGAALATVCTQRLEHTPAYREKIAACYTFGSPRVGDEHYDLEFKSPIYRIVNTTDIVTIVPLLAMGYIHIGDVRFLGHKEADVVRRSVPIFSRLFQFLFTVFKLFVPLVGDHAITEYRRKLETVAQDRNLDLYGQGNLGMKRKRFGR
jgi:triacylglycerol lipase